MANLEHKRAVARGLFVQTLLELAPARLVREQLRLTNGTLSVGNDARRFSLREYRNVLVIAFGKAAVPMLEGARQLSETLTQQLRTLGTRAVPALNVILCSPDEPPSSAAFSGTVTAFRGGHPEPNEQSIRAARAMLAAVASIGEPGLVIYLISGGGSALVEAPLDARLSLIDLQATYRALVLGGAPIGEINILRKHLSAIKGGRLAAAAETRDVDQLSLILSDVPPDQLSSVSSGPTLADESTVNDCYRLCAKYDFDFPAAVARLFTGRQLQETPKPGDRAFARSTYHLLADNDVACEVLAGKARQEGFSAQVDHTADEWEYQAAARYLLDRLHQLKAADPRSCLVAGGEVLVKVKNGGRGGRNQQFALECARQIAGNDICVLSGATDGVDGNSAAAGAIVDGTTARRAVSVGFDVSQHLQRYDTYPLLAHLRDTIEIGATGNNIRDLRLLF